VHVLRHTCAGGGSSGDYSLFALLTQWVPHPFAFGAKGWVAGTSTDRGRKSKEYRSVVPTLQRTRGWGTSVVLIPAKTKGGPPADGSLRYFDSDDWDDATETRAVTPQHLGASPTPFSDLENV
jgi:hypothetical protein